MNVSRLLILAMHRQQFAFVTLRAVRADLCERDRLTNSVVYGNRLRNARIRILVFNVRMSARIMKKH